LVQQSCGINRVRSCPQQPGLVALWGDNGSVRLLDVGEQLQQLAAEQEVASKAASKSTVRGLGIQGCRL
jgi:ribosome assembly protein RRB1